MTQQEAGREPEESPEVKAARERLTGLLLLAAFLIGVACGVATGDGGLGFGAFIAACLVGGMILQRRHPPPNPEPPPRWGIVASFIAGPMLIAIGVFNIVDGSTVTVGDDIPLIQGDELAGAIRIVCGVISIWFAFDQRALRRRRAEAIKAVVRAGLREATLNVGGGWVRPPAGPSGLAEATRERRPAALAPRDVVPLDLAPPAAPTPPPHRGGGPSGPPGQAFDGGHWEGGVFLWDPPESEFGGEIEGEVGEDGAAPGAVGDEAVPAPDGAPRAEPSGPPPEAGSEHAEAPFVAEWWPEPDLDAEAAAAEGGPGSSVEPPASRPDGGLVHGPPPSALAAAGRGEPSPRAEAEAAVPDWFAAMWDGPPGEPVSIDEETPPEPGREVDPVTSAAAGGGVAGGPAAAEVDDLPPLPRRVRGASLFRPSRLSGSLEDSLEAELQAPSPQIAEPPPSPAGVEASSPDPTATDPEPEQQERDAEVPVVDRAAEPDPTPAVVAPVEEVAAPAPEPEPEPEPAAQADEPEPEPEAAVVDLAALERDGTPESEPGEGEERPPLPRGIRILRKREPRPEFDSDELV